MISSTTIVNSGQDRRYVVYFVFGRNILYTNIVYKNYKIKVKAKAYLK